MKHFGQETNRRKKYRNDKNYFQPLYQEIQNGGAAAMLHELLAMDLQDWHPRYEMPKTKALRDQKELSLSPADQWWLQLLKSAALPRHSADDSTRNPRCVTSRTLMDAARKTVPGLRYESDTKLGRILSAKGCVHVEATIALGGFRN